MTAKMAGDLGDLLFAMCAFRALGGGTLCLHSEKWTRERMTDEKIASIRSLLETQPYIKEVRWLKDGEAVDTNLNDFRAEYFRTFNRPDFPKRRNLCEWILRTHGVDPAKQNEHWLVVEEPSLVARVVINRTPRYQNPNFPWAQIIKKYGGDIAFVGTPAEYLTFTQTFGDVDYITTQNLLAVAQVIAGADLFIGNQSCPYAIAEGLKKPAVLEVCPWLPNCLFDRPDCWHGWDASSELPDLC